MDFIKGLMGGAIGIVWALAGPLTYIVGVVDTWHGKSGVFVKILISLTLDAVLAAIWPITWLIWLVMHALGNSTPLSTVLGF